MLLFAGRKPVGEADMSLDRSRRFGWPIGGRFLRRRRASVLSALSSPAAVAWRSRRIRARSFSTVLSPEPVRPNRVRFGDPGGRAAATAAARPLFLGNGRPGDSSGLPQPVSSSASAPATRGKLRQTNSTC